MQLTNDVKPQSRLVLLVDPHRDSAEMYAVALNDVGFHTRIATEGESAVRLAFDLCPNVVVSEAMLPDMSGLALVKRLREYDVATVILTASLLPTDQRDAIQAGCDALLAKPCLPDALVDEIGRVLITRDRIEFETRRRIRAEYVEMPGMRLRVEQVQRLCGVDRPICGRVLNALVAERFLTANPDGTYTRATDGPAPDVRRITPITGRNHAA